MRLLKRSRSIRVVICLVVVYQFIMRHWLCICIPCDTCRVIAHYMLLFSSCAVLFVLYVCNDVSLDKKHCLVLTSRGPFCPICFFAQVIARCPRSCISYVFFNQATYSELQIKFRNFLRVLRVSGDSSLCSFHSCTSAVQCCSGGAGGGGGGGGGGRVSRLAPSAASAVVAVPL